MSIDLMRFRIGVAQRELGNAFVRFRHTTDQLGARVARPLLLGEINRVPFPTPAPASFGALIVWPNHETATVFAQTPIARRWSARAVEHCRMLLSPVKSHGTWWGADPLPGELPQRRPEGSVVVLTHGQLHLRHLHHFWANNPHAAAHMRCSHGLLFDQGWANVGGIDAGTLSIWRSLGDVTRFAYGPGKHQPQVRRLREEGWTRQTWFARFTPVSATGTWRGVSPFANVVPAQTAASAESAASAG